MHSIHKVMSCDHRRCDDMFVEAQKSAARKDWTNARQHTDLFIRNMLQHFNHEETVLFPGFEQASGMTRGPTEVMREEHKTMCELFDELREAAVAESSARFLGVAESLFIYMQQHNIKEESVLYPMMDQYCPAKELPRSCTIQGSASYAA